jgi:hypothetical protein
MRLDHEVACGELLIQCCGTFHSVVPP